MDFFSSFLDLFRKVFKKPETTGFIPDDIDLRDAWFDHVFGITDPTTFKPSINWMPSVSLRRQGYWPLCVSMAVAHCFYFFTGKEISVRYLAVKSGTTYRGTSIRAALEALRNGCVLENKLPFDFTVPLNRWDSVITTPNFGKEDQVTIDGYVRIDPQDKNAIKAALQKGPLVIAFGFGDGYANGGIVKNPPFFRVYHSVLLTGYDENENWFIGDSLVPQEKVLSKYYSIPWVYQITKLPEDWKNRQIEHLFNSYIHLLKERFGKPRDFANEQAEAQLLAKLTKPLIEKRPELGGILGKFWIVYVAAFYGGWTLQDCINDAIRYADTGNHLHNFNEEKSL